MIALFYSMKSIRKVIIRQNHAPKIFLACELCTVKHGLQHLKTHYFILLLTPHYSFHLTEQQGHGSTYLVQKATGESHIKALPAALNHLSRVSLPPVSPISPPTPQLTFEDL